MARNNLPKAVQDCHNLLTWLIPLLDNIARDRRFTPGDRLEASLTEAVKVVILPTCRSYWPGAKAE